jgi:phenylalanyl-tRNA synthetase beta chain
MKRNQSRIDCILNTTIQGSSEQSAELIGARLVEIEKTIPLTEMYKDVVVAKIITCAPVEDSDHLNLTKIDDGGVVHDVERDENGYVQVVCGAPNVREGMLVAWLPPASTVPESFNDTEPFVLGARKLRGYMSNGMLASAKELALFEDHEGILEIDKDVQPGTLFADVYELNDTLLDIENKSLTHRPDAFGVVGFAREIAGIQGQQFVTPDWLRDINAEIASDSSVEAPRIIIEDTTLSDRFSAIVLTDASQSAQAPLELQTYLSRSGIRPINAIVDVTNYLMLLTGQPMHAYDYDKVLAVSGGVNEIRVRAGRTDETLTLLDGRVVNLDTDDMVIAAGDVAIGLAGAMGGAATEIDSSTTRILLEAATFNLYKLRNIQMKHGVFTEAITRLTKGVPAQLSRPVLAEAVRMLGALTGATAASGVTEDYPGYVQQPTIELPLAVINETLGTTFSSDEVVRTLGNVELTVWVESDSIRIEVPYWRHDLHIAEDIIEEVGRLTGFDNVSPTLPRRDFVAVKPSTFEQLRSKLRNTLIRSGANEVLTYSFIHGDTMRTVGQDVQTAYRITNSISPELQYYRQSITPSLLTLIHPNTKNGFDHFAVFEFNKFHTKVHPLTEEGVPKELDSLAFVVSRTKRSVNDAYYEAKQYVEAIAQSLGLSFVYEPLEVDSLYPVTQPFEPKRSARIWNADKTERIGVVGEFKRSVQKGFKLPESTAGFEISPQALLKLSTINSVNYVPVSKYPSVERDLCFQVAQEVQYDAVYNATVDAATQSGVVTEVQPLDIYVPTSGETKNITLRITFTAHDRTLTGEEVQVFTKTIIQHVTDKTNGKVI